MTKKASAVKLAKTNRYCTYQFYGEMANKNTNLKDGLKYAILTTFEWLRERISEDNVPDELKMPESGEYKKADDSLFKSFSLSDSYTIDVISDIEEGIWSIKIIEADSGQLNEDKVPVPGRTIQSDIGFRIVDGRLECGFKTTVFDSTETEMANCIRFKLIRDLGYSSVFGLRQLNNLSDYSNREIHDDASFENLKYLVNSEENQLPILIYADSNIGNGKPDLKLPFSTGIIPKTDNILLLNKNKSESLKQDIEHMDVTCRKYYGHARIFFVARECFAKVASLLNKTCILPDEVIVIDAKKDGGKSKKYAHSDKTYSNYVTNYQREKTVDYKDVLFVDEARILTKVKDEERHKEKSEALEKSKEVISTLKGQIDRTNRISEYESDDDSEYIIECLNSKIDELTNEKEVLLKEKRRLENELIRKDSYIQYLERKEKWPDKHKDIAEWCSDFKYVELDTKAVNCLESNDATNVKCDVIVDALDYLEYAYAKYLFGEISEDMLLEIQSNIYDRPYNVTPSGIPTSAKSDCKIRYSFGVEKKREYLLDQHLKIGAHGENLLRIYFLIDKDRKKIVIGSLPNHLKY